MESLRQALASSLRPGSRQVQLAVKNSLRFLCRWGIWSGPVILPVALPGIGSLPALVIVLLGVLLAPFRGFLKRAMVDINSIRTGLGFVIGVGLYLLTTFVVEPALQWFL